MWCERISQIPSPFTQAVIENLPDGILSREARAFLFEFLEQRKSEMRTIIEEHQSLFPALRKRGG